MLIPSVPLDGRFVRLVPLAPEHDAELKAACDADLEIWTLYPMRMDGEAYEGWRGWVDGRVARGEVLAYAILQGAACVGVSLFMLDLANRRVEIGNTYLHPDVRGGPVNPEAKRLMMRHAFDCGVNCVAYKVDALNLRSRRAVARLGAHEDGIVRADRITWTGRVRNTVNFSILKDEWPEVEQRLLERLEGMENKGMV